MHKIRTAHQYIDYQDWSYYHNVIPKQTKSCQARKEAFNIGNNLESMVEVSKHG